ncbi:MAG: hypothetical protein MZV64_11930 [Ignavibacteriales bacterium]|nr:hypothetical protein [Ignavibacteriales bacterium]
MSSCGLLGHLGVEVVHQHPQRRFLGPALGRQCGTPSGALIFRTGSLAAFAIFCLL